MKDVTTQRPATPAEARAQLTRLQEELGDLGTVVLLVGEYVREMAGCAERTLPRPQLTVVVGAARGRSKPRGQLRIVAGAS